MMHNDIRTIVIIGGGTAGWMAAAVLSKAFGPLVTIRLVESEAIGIVGVGEATIPQIQLVNRFLGLDENAFLRATQGTFKLGIRFNGWRSVGDSYLHAFGDIGLSIGLLDFHHYWLRDHAERSRPDLWSYSLNAVCAAKRRFSRLETIAGTPLPGIRHAFHFDASLYARYLRAYAEARGVVRTEGRVVDVQLHPETGFIRSVMLKDGESIGGDLFLDCSGFGALLIGKALGIDYDDWSRWLPCDRASTVGSSRTAPLLPYTQADARPAGWQWRIPLQHRTGNGYVYCSRYLGDDEAAATLLGNLDGEALTEPRTIRFTTGVRRKFWYRNCVALGLASGFLEPLESTAIHLIQSGISRLVSMFPHRDFDEHVIDEYNRRQRFEFESIRNFLVLHYTAVERDDSRFWKDCSTIRRPPELQDKIDLFRSSGVIYRDGEELFTSGSWLQVMLGQGIVPRRYHRLADDLPDQKLRGLLDQMRTQVEQAAESLPGHADFVARHCASPASVRSSAPA